MIERSPEFGLRYLKVPTLVCGPTNVDELERLVYSRVSGPTLEDAFSFPFLN